MSTAYIALLAMIYLALLALLWELTKITQLLERKEDNDRETRFCIRDAYEYLKVYIHK